MNSHAHALLRAGLATFLLMKVAAMTALAAEVFTVTSKGPPLNVPAGQMATLLYGNSSLGGGSSLAHVTFPDGLSLVMPSV